MGFLKNEGGKGEARGGMGAKGREKFELKGREKCDLKGREKECEWTRINFVRARCPPQNCSFHSALTYPSLTLKTHTFTTT